MNIKLTIDEILAKFSDQKFAKENFQTDPIVYFAVMSLSAGTDPILVIEHLLKERKEVMENYQKLAEAVPIHYIVATEETIERLKKEKEE